MNNVSEGHRLPEIVDVEGPLLRRLCRCLDLDAFRGRGEPCWSCINLKNVRTAHKSD